MSQVNNHCLLCYTNSAGDTFGFPLSPAFVDRPLVFKQLHVIFLLQNLLEIPSTQLETYLSTAGNPEAWITLCSKCNSLVEQAKTAYEMQLHATTKFRQIKREIVDIAKGSATSGSGTNNQSDITEQARRYVYEHEYGPWADPFVTDLFAKGALQNSEEPEPEPVPTTQLVMNHEEPSIIPSPSPSPDSKEDSKLDGEVGESETPVDMEDEHGSSTSSSLSILSNKQAGTDTSEKISQDIPSSVVESSRATQKLENAPARNATENGEDYCEYDNDWGTDLEEDALGEQVESMKSFSSSTDSISSTRTTTNHLAVSQVDKFPCSACDLILPSAIARRQRLKLAHVLYCEICEEKSATQAELDHHISCHRQALTY